MLKQWKWYRYNFHFKFFVTIWLNSWVSFEEVILKLEIKVRCRIQRGFPVQYKNISILFPQYFIGSVSSIYTRLPYTFFCKLYKEKKKKIVCFCSTQIDTDVKNAQKKPFSVYNCSTKIRNYATLCIFQGYLLVFKQWSDCLQMSSQVFF